MVTLRLDFVLKTYYFARLIKSNIMDFVANPWTLEENQRPFIPYKGSVVCLRYGAGDEN